MRTAFTHRRVISDHAFAVPTAISGGTMAVSREMYSLDANSTRPSMIPGETFGEHEKLLAAVKNGNHRPPSGRARLAIRRADRRGFNQTAGDDGRDAGMRKASSPPFAHSAM